MVKSAAVLAPNIFFGGGGLTGNIIFTQWAIQIILSINHVIGRHDINHLHS